MTTKPSIVADGRSRLAQSEEYQTLRRELRKAVATRYAAALAEAGFFGRLALRWRMHREIRRELDRIRPSCRSLWLANRAPDYPRLGKREV